jgi:MFS family permease
MSPELRRVVIPQFVLFFLLGAAFAAWASRIPAIRDAIGLTPATLTLVLVGRGFGTVVAFPVSTWLAGRFGARTSSLIAGIGLLLSIPIIAVVPTWQSLAVALFFSGLVTSCYDVAINALGTASEHQTGVPIMSRLHAFFGVGNFIGAIAGIGAAKLGLSPVVHFSISSGLLMGVLIYNYRFLPEAAPHKVEVRFFSIPSKELLVLGLIGFLSSVTESSVNSWVTLMFRDRLAASEALAPAGYAAFAAAMLFFRFFGDRLKLKYGARTVLVSGTVAAGAGLFLAAWTDSVAVASFGLLLAGAGIAVVFPFLFSAAGKMGPSALAAVATLGYAGGILAPPLMGFMVEKAGLDGGFFFLSGSALLMALIALRAQLLQ